MVRPVSKGTHLDVAVPCSRWNFDLLMLVVILALPAISFAQARTNAVRETRIHSAVDNKQRTMLRGHTISALEGATDMGRLAGATPMNHLVMVLQSSPEQEHALRTLIDQQLDKNHSNYHQWMKPEEFGSHFGVADSDISQVTDWLTQQGFRVEHVAPSKRFIQFSGNVSQVESAFQTEMHRYSVNGKMHVANARDISIPSALRPVVSAVPTLHDFFKKAGFQSAGVVTSDPLTGKVYEADPFTGVPDYTSGATHFVGAGDFAVIYDTNPLLQAGINGSGVSIGIIGRTDIHLSDVQIYREFFSLPNNDPIFVIAGEDPGIVGGDDGESYLDVEVSGGAAPGAAVNFIASRATLTTDGVDLSAMYAVQNNLTDIISESYGQCEAAFSAAQAAFYNSLWVQAAAQGQSVFVSSGDNGPAACDSASSNFETHGYAVSMLASSPYNVAVGGTLFADTNCTTCWGTAATSTPPFSSALSYIPEIPWNEARGSGAVGASELWSGSGGISAYFMTPSWQRGFGVPTSDPPYPNVPISIPATPFVPGPHRYLPDVSMAAAAQHDGTLFCAEGICQLSSTGTIVNAGIVGGTSVAAPTMAGVQALINQRNGGRQGLPNYFYYALADAQHAAGLNCSAEAGTAMNPSCAFHDVDQGNTLVCSDSACTSSLKIGWMAAPGYDFAAGLGSPDAANLANLWSTVHFNSSLTTLSVSQTTGITHGQAVTLSGTVTPGAGGGIPSGNIAFIASNGSAMSDPVNASTGGFQNPIALATLDAGGDYSFTFAGLPAGDYFLTARYAGDGTFASSLSAPIEVVVSPEDSTATIRTNSLNKTTCVETPTTTFTYGSYIWTDVMVTGASGQGVPTGFVSVTDNNTSLASLALNATGVGHMLSGAIPGNSCVSGYTFQDTPPLTVGTHVLGASYTGDQSFGSVISATPITVTITKATLTGTLVSNATNINSGDPVQLNFTLAGLSGAGPGTLSPTGFVTFTDTTTSNTLGFVSLSPIATSGGSAIFNTSGITGNGAHSIQASWKGDGAYNAASSSAVTVTVQNGTTTTTALTSTANPTVVGGLPTFTAAVSSSGGGVTSGNVNFYDGKVLLGSGAVNSSTHAATFTPAASVNLSAGTHFITASYSGNATFNSSTSAALPEVINQAQVTIQLTARNSGSVADTFSLSGTLSAVPGVTPSGVVNATPPTGQLTFFDGAKNIGSAPFTTVSAGFGIWQAILSPQFNIGTHTITARLQDPNYTAAVSNSQTITVGPQSQTILFAPIPSHTFGDPDFTVTATASSGLAVTFTATGNCTITGNQVHLTGAGSCSITASQAGDSNFEPAPSVTRTFTIAKANQTISFGTIPNHTFGDADFTVSATASSGLTVSFSANGNCTLNGNTVHLTGAGSCTITASQAGDANNNAAMPVPQSFNINKANQTIVFGLIANHTFGDADFTVSATASSGLTVSFSANGNCTINGNTVHLTGAGSCTITASQAGDANNNAAMPVPQPFNINKANQTIAFGPIADHTFGDADFTVSATASSGLAVTFSASGTCSVTMNTVHIAGAGSCAITASQAGDANTNAATPVPQSFNINKANQTIAFGPIADHIFGDADFAVTAMASSGLAISFTASGNCTVTGSSVHITGAGSCAITASQAGDANTNAATPVPQSFNINKVNQTITFGPIADHTFGDADFAVTATASSGLAISFTASGNCTVTGSSVHITGAGSCAITASQAGDPNTKAATPVPQSFNINKANQTIVFGPIADHTFGDADFTVSATASSGLAVAFSASGTCSVTMNIVHITGAGSCAITASQAGDANTNAATPVPQSFNINKANQTITFGPIADHTFGDADFIVTATASSGLVVSFTASGNCTVTGNSVHITGAGSCMIAASQPGDANHGPATSVSQSFNIGKANQTITFDPLANKNVGDPDFMVSATASSGLAVGFTAAGNCLVTGNLIHLTGAGSCTITASQAGDANNNPAMSVSQSFNIGKANQTITFAVLPDRTFGDPDFMVNATASSGLSVSFAAVGTCSVTGNLVHLTGAGTCSITASQAGDANTNPATSVAQSFNIARANQAITFGPLPDKNFGDPDFAVGATASSGLAVSFTAAGSCTVIGNLVHLTAAGLCSITASQVGNTNFNAAPSVTQSFNVKSTTNKKDQTIRFGPIPNKRFGEPDFNVNARATSGLSMSFSATGDCTITGNTVHLTGAGSCSITASQPGDATYNAATPVTQSFTIFKAHQRITFLPLERKRFGDPDFAIEATASSGLPVSFSAEGDCTVSGNIVHLTGGTFCVITASQDGNDDYDAAPSVKRFQAIERADQTIAFAPLPDRAFGAPNFVVNATTSSGLPVTFRAGGRCTISGNLVHLTGPGFCSIKATQSGNENYRPAPEVTQSFDIAKTNQTISFGPLPNKKSGDPDFTVSATASSGLTVKFSASGDCTIRNGNTVHLTHSGSCSVTASQNGNNDHNSANPVIRAFTISGGSQLVIGSR